MRAEFRLSEGAGQNAEVLDTVGGVINHVPSVRFVVNLVTSSGEGETAVAEKLEETQCCLVLDKTQKYDFWFQVKFSNCKDMTKPQYVLDRPQSLLVLNLAVELQIAQSRPCSCCLGPKVCLVYILGALGL